MSGQGGENRKATVMARFPTNPLTILPFLAIALGNPRPFEGRKNLGKILSRDTAKATRQIITPWQQF